MIKISKNLFLLSLLAAVVSQGAYAGVRLELVGVGDQANWNVSGLTDPAGNAEGATGKFGFGGGALLGFHLGSMVSLETGALYYQRKVDLTDPAVGLDDVFTFPTIQIPVVLRFWLGHHFSIGAGGYVASAAGQWTEANGGTTGNLSDLGITNLDYGVLGSVSLDLPLGSSMGFVVDGRYCLGLSNQTTLSGASLKISDIQVLAGLRFGGGMMK